ncbi:MAG TPA: hypothetical protein VF173_06550, partial [Thermoanaerobaculia bacterium]|nr:hypothetical protein [Thermoanaerobaculia bacterium]
GFPFAGEGAVFASGSGIGNRVSLMSEVSHEHEPIRGGYPEFFHSLSAGQDDNADLWYVRYSVDGSVRNKPRLPGKEIS